ncbi:MAG: glycosyltransferase family 39 protein [Planctomycetaceae bacterium]|nr:glycosyltransferase family 39 protein [Planctomycetaceae bacterium]
MAILIVAFGLRLLAAFAVEHHVQKAGRAFLIEGDANGYWELAQKIAAGQDYCIHQPPRYVLRTPGFPLLLAASIELFGPSILCARIVLAGIGAGCCWLTWYLARLLFTEKNSAAESIGLMAAAIMAIAPLQVGNSVLILSETLFAFGLLTCLILLVKLLKFPGQILRWAGLLGVSTGLTVLIRPGWILWPIVSSGLVLLLSTAAYRWRMAAIAVILLGCFLVLLPWAWRNHDVTGHWVFTSLWSGPSLYDGMHANATGASDMRFVDEENVYATMSEYDANEHYKSRAIAFALANKMRAVELGFVKAGRYLSLTLNASGFADSPASLVSVVFYLVFFAAVILGVYRWTGSPAGIAVLAAPFLLFLLVHMAFVGSIRYRLPVEFPLSIFAANALQGWDWRGWFRKNSPRT